MQRRLVLLASSLLAVLALFTAGIAHVPTAHACSCAGEPDPWIAARNSSIVFVGCMINSRDEGNNPTGKSSGEPVSGIFISRAYDFEVLSVLSGIPTTRATVFTGRGGGDCGVVFGYNAIWVVYAYGGAADAYSTGICTRTAPIASAAEDLRALGPGTPVLTDEILLMAIPKEALERTRGFQPYLRTLLAVLVGVGCLLGFALWYRKRRSTAD
jgi:hypothetical protein